MEGDVFNVLYIFLLELEQLLNLPRACNSHDVSASLSVFI